MALSGSLRGLASEVRRLGADLTGLCLGIARSGVAVAAAVLESHPRSIFLSAGVFLGVIATGAFAGGES